MSAPEVWANWSLPRRCPGLDGAGHWGLPSRGNDLVVPSEKTLGLSADAKLIPNAPRAVHPEPKALLRISQQPANCICKRLTIAWRRQNAVSLRQLEGLRYRRSVRPPKRPHVLRDAAYCGCHEGNPACPRLQEDGAERFDSGSMHIKVASTVILRQNLIVPDHRDEHHPHSID